MTATYSDHEVIQALLDGDRIQINQVMDYLYNQHFEGVRSYVLVNSGMEEEVHDVFQDALVILYMRVKKGGYQLRSSLKTYIFGIVKNLWLKELRQKRRVGHHLEMAPDTESFMEELNLQESQITLRSLLELIDKECRQLLVAFYFEGNSVKSLTTEYNLGSEAALKNKKYRCLQKLVRMVKSKKLRREDVQE